MVQGRQEAECVVKTVKMQLPRPPSHGRALSPSGMGPQPRTRLFPGRSQGGSHRSGRTSLPTGSHIVGLHTALDSLQGTVALIVSPGEEDERTEGKERKWLVQAAEPQVLALGPIRCLSCCSPPTWGPVPHSLSNKQGDMRKAPPFTLAEPHTTC